MSTSNEDAVIAIEALIQRQFKSLSWTDDVPPAFDVFASDFHCEARLFPTARPAQAQRVDNFIERMQGLAQSSLRQFDEKVLGSDIRVFGNIAVAAIACEQIENGCTNNRTVEMMLLVCSEGQWKIVAQAWDKATAENALPAALLTP